jgi:hypothetical protein
MNHPPKELDGARIICFAQTLDAIIPTGKTTHRKGGEVLSPTAALAICQYLGEGQSMRTPNKAGAGNGGVRG